MKIIHLGNLSSRKMKTAIELYMIQKVKEKRTELGMSQSVLADCLNLSKGFIGNVENPKCRAKYNLNHLNEIAKIMNCSLYDFFPDKPL